MSKKKIIYIVVLVVVVIAVVVALVITGMKGEQSISEVSDNKEAASEEQKDSGSEEKADIVLRR